MSCVWLATIFCYYLILSLINTFDDIYETAIISSVTEMCANVISGLFL